jgi:uncharacterized protein (TIGR00369 family)
VCYYRYGSKDHLSEEEYKMTEDHLLWLRKHLEDIYRSEILENFLELQILEIKEGSVVYQLKIAGKHCNMYGFVHGGTLSSVSDVAMGVSCITLGKRVVTIDMSVSYIRNAPSGSILTAKGKVISKGKTIMRAVSEIYHEEQLLVRSQASYFVIGDYHQDDYPQEKIKEE